MARKRKWSWETPEEPKAHEEIPDGLGIGIREERDPLGQLVIYLEPSLIPTPYIVLGKYKVTQPNGAEYYVADWTLPGVNPTTSKHDHLLMALAAVHEIAAENQKHADRRKYGRSSQKKDLT